MENLDEFIKGRSIFDAQLIPDGFDSRSDALLKSLGTPNQRVRHIRFMSGLRFAAAIVLIVVLLTGAAIAAYTLSGGDYFRQLFQNVADKSDGSYGYMNTAQLGEMASSTVGNVIDTDDLSIDVLGVIVSGKTADIALKITAKKLDTVLYDTGIEPLMNYRFHNDWFVYILRNGLKYDPGGFQVNTRYIYSDKDKSLAPNQFIIRYSLVSDQPLKDKTLTFEFDDFGYFDFNELDQFEQLYTGEYVFDITFDPTVDTSRTVLLGESLTVNHHAYTVDSAEITPLSCIVKISTEENYDRYDTKWPEVWTVLFDSAQDMTVNLADGTRLGSGQYELGGGGGAESGFELIVTFNVPVTVGDVVSITLGGIEIPLK